MWTIGRLITRHDAPMRIADFALERFFARWEFAVKHLLCASDVEGWQMGELLELADDETRGLWDGLRLGYTESTGHPLLRAEIAELYERIEPDGVLVFAGAEEAIFCLANMMLGPTDHALVTWPGYQSLYEVARATGADVSLHELHEADGWELDVDRLLAAVRPETRLVVVNAPHNPTGMLPTHAEWSRLTGVLADRGIHLLSDEVYRFLERDERDRLIPGADAYPRGISLGVMSKSFAMAGLRIGWLATRDDELLARCAAFKDYTTICSSAPSEILALIGLRAREQVLGRSLRIVSDNLELLDDFFRRRSDTFSWVRPRGSSVGFPRLLRGGPIDRFANDLVEAEGVLLLPGPIFGHPGDHFRLGFGRADLPIALAKLEDYVDRAFR
jgi:aspartate/methionine/tyrosine aminotransferase